MWRFVFWVSLGAVFYSYLGYPLILYIIHKLKIRARHRYDEGETPSLCLIISAFNEEKIIRKKIENSLSLDYPRHLLSILVASDGSDDQTRSITEDYEHHGVKLYHWSKRAGKSAVLNQVVSQLTDEIIVFTDANSLFAEDALRKIVRHFHDRKIGCVVGKLCYVDRHTTSVGKGEGLYWKYEAKLSGLESDLQSVLVANGSIFGIRRELFPELYPEVANDFQIPVDIASRNYGIIYEPEAVAIERSTIFWQEEFQRKTRIILRGLTGFMKLRKKFTGFRRWQFFSHKLLRWFIGPLLFINLFANAVLANTSAFFMVLLGLQVVFYLAALNGWRMRKARKPHPMFYLPFYFTMVNLAAVMAIAKFIAGERTRVWEKAESARFAPTGVNGGYAVTGLKQDPAGTAAPLPEHAEAVPHPNRVAKP
jgi:cellulose synthase/poly-beta-1,6-N-acetylglucosamine synthase-like glycosyltransferase